MFKWLLQIKLKIAIKDQLIPIEMTGIRWSVQI
jgi:hypothetical protein